MGNLPMARGFTLIEMVVIVAVLAMFSALVVPNIANQQAGIRRRAFFEGLEKLVSDAHESSIEIEDDVALRYDDGPQEVLSRQTDTTGTTSNVGDRVTVPDGVRIAELHDGADTVSTADFKINFLSRRHERRGGCSSQTEAT